jgi:hypothetical protein
MKILAAISVIAALALGAGQALAAGSHHNSTPKTLKVVMRDPGCHWFLVHGKDVKTTSVAGPIRLQNFDEDTIKVASHMKVRRVHVGSSIVLKRGHYMVTMVKQASDDNHLRLTVR